MAKRIYLMGLALVISLITRPQEVILGVDLSYANEMEDCNALFYQNGMATDIYEIFKENQAQVIRFRLWHNPNWSNYSNYQDVEKGIVRAKEAGMKVLLDFHYSDTWADPAAQECPAAWKGITDLEVLADSVYNYTFKVLSRLESKELMPEFVQIGNETNGNIIINEGESLYPINWQRNVKLFKAGIKAANDVDSLVKTVLHIANPSHADSWFSSAKTNDLTEFDIIGLSYYPQWHELDISQVGNVVKSLTNKFSKPVWIVETGYPWTLDGNDNAGNILGEESILTGYSNPPTKESQKTFLIKLTYTVISNGGMGTIYWEPAWVSTTCSTQWGEGSHYENATFFDYSNQLHQGIDFLTYDYAVEPSNFSQVTFYVDMTDVTIIEDVYVTGDFTGTNWQFMKMTPVGSNIYKYTIPLEKGTEGAYIFTVKADWNLALYHEKVPTECAPLWGTHRKYIITNDEETFAFKWSSCDSITVGVGENHQIKTPLAFPNPFKNLLTLNTKIPNAAKVKIWSMDGSYETVFPATTKQINSSTWSEGVYLIQYINKEQQVIDSIKVIKTN